MPRPSGRRAPAVLCRLPCSSHQPSAKSSPAGSLRPRDIEARRTPVDMRLGMIRRMDAVISIFTHPLTSDDPGWCHTDQRPERVAGEPHEVLDPLAGVVALADPSSDLLEVPDVP